MALYNMSRHTTVRKCVECVVKIKHFLPYFQGWKLLINSLNRFHLQLYDVGHTVKRFYLRLYLTLDIRLRYFILRLYGVDHRVRRFHLRLYGVGHTVKRFHLRLYGVGHRVKDHRDGRSPLPPLLGPKSLSLSLSLSLCV